MRKNFSLFHAELVDFIENQAKEHIGFEGWNPSFHPEFAQFQKKIKQSRELEDSLFPLGDIIESYHSLLEGRDAMHLEKKLLEIFSSKQEREPLRIYRGLPRLYKKDRPADSRVKKQFTHLPTLKRLIAENSIFKLYDAYPVPGLARVSFFTWATEGNLDDYISAFQAISLVKERFPDLDLSWVVLIPKPKLRSPRFPQGCKTHLIPYEREISLSLFDREALEILRTSDLIVQLPTFYPALSQLQKEIAAVPFSRPLPKWVSIGEYGCVESSTYHPRTQNRSMGLHFLEKGILICRRPSVEMGFHKVENEQLLQGLFSTLFPDLSQIERYRKENHFYLAHLSSPIGGAVYLHALIYAHEKDEKGIDLCIPDPGWLIRYIDLQTQEGLSILKVEGISLEFHYEGKCFALTPKGNKKRVRIFCPFELLPSDFTMLMHLSGEFVGVRGDQSFTEAVSADKGFFYDGRIHARYFIKDLIALAENRIGAYRSSVAIFRAMSQTFLHNLSPEEGEWVEETHFQEKLPWIEIAKNVGMALRDPHAIAGFKKFHQILTEEKSFNTKLCQLIQRELCHRYRTDAKELEEQAMNLFVDGSCSLPQLLSRILTNSERM